MNTVIKITVYDYEEESILTECFDICREYENILSTTIEASEINKLNSKETGQTKFELSQETKEVLEKGLYYSKISKGSFDITIGSVSRLWDFTSGKKLIPDETSLQQAVQHVGYDKIELKENELVFLDTATRIDLGAIAKGYIADKIKEHLLEKGVKSAVIDLGGNVLCVGQKPDGSAFKVGIQRPFEDRNETIELLNIKDMSVASSGVYERHFVLDNINYHHLLNPKTGYPYDNGLISVTVLTEKSIDGDALSTVCFSLGLDEGMDLINSLENTYAFFIDKEYNVYYSDGFEAFIAND